MTCSRCQCQAGTTRDGRPVCWWHADKGLDGTPCEKCGDASAPAAPDPTEARLDALDAQLDALDKRPPMTLFDVDG